MKSESFKLAVVQMNVEGGERDQNLRCAQTRIEEAVKNNANVVLLPESMDLGWTHPSALTDAEPVPEGKTYQFLITMAKQYRLYICSGLIEKERERIYNAAVIVNPAGEVILRHRKINELDIGRKYYACGDRLNVCQIEWGIFGLVICADAKNSELTRSLGQMNAEVILSPCSWAVPADHDNNTEPYGEEWREAYIPVAKDFSLWIAGSSNVGWMTAGPWKGYKAIGCSLVIDNNGKVAANGPYGVDKDTILYVDITPLNRHIK